MKNGYTSYLNYKQVLELLKKKTSVYEISNVTGIHEPSGYQLATKNSTKAERLFILKKHRRK